MLEIYDFPDQNTQMFNNEARHCPVNSVNSAVKYDSSNNTKKCNIHEQTSCDSVSSNNTTETISSLFFRLWGLVRDSPEETAFLRYKSTEVLQ